MISNFRIFRFTQLVHYLSKRQALTPILFIDALDFLISDQEFLQNEKSEVWDEFVTILEGGVNIIFTTNLMSGIIY